MAKNLAPGAGHTGDAGELSRLGRAPGVGNDSTLQYSCLGNSMAKGAWQATVHGVPRGWTRLDTHTVDKERIIGNIR